MPETIDAKELQIVKIFGDDYRFEIPDYQRPYAWTKEEVGELLDDLIQAMDRENTKEMNEIPPYFLGSIVLIKGTSSPRAYVVDGQQRITTLTILLCVLRELSTDEKSRNTLNRYVREDSDEFAGVEGRFRLNVRMRDRDFFQSNIQDMGTLGAFLNHPYGDLPDSRQRMFENAKYLWCSLSTLDEEGRKRLTSLLIQRCYIVVVSTSDQRSAYRIFAVMNGRGLDLSATDILKADVIGEMNESIRPKYTDIWEGIEEEIGRADFRDLFAHIRMVYMKKKMRRGTLQDEFKEGVLNSEDVKSKNFIDDVLTPFADPYKIVSRAGYKSADGAEKVNQYLEYLNRLDNFDWIPAAMLFFKRNPNDTHLLARFVRDLERLAYGLFIMRANVNERIDRYAGVLEDIEQGIDLFDDTARLQVKPEDKAKILQALDGPIYTIPRIPGPLLRRLDSLLAEEGVKHDYSTVSIEHVLPQSPESGSEWITLFPNEEERKQWTHKLANLVLLSRRKNSQAQNYEFERKKSEYFQKKGVTTFALTTQVVNEVEWTPNVLERRQLTLIDTLKNEWRLN